MARFLVTGATSGLGLEMARRLVADGQSVWLHARSEASGAAALEQTGAERAFSADLAELDEVRACVDQVATAGGVDVLVNNAGAFFKELGHTQSGLERHFAVNHLGPFVLATSLLPAVRERVVIVASDAHKQARPDWEDLQWRTRSWSSMRAYADSKLFNILFAQQLALRSELSVNSLHPGFVNTGIGDRGASGLVQKLGRLLKALGKSPQSAVTCQLWAATSTQAGAMTGQYFVKSEVVKPTAMAQDSGLAERLWRLSESLSS